MLLTPTPPAGAEPEPWLFLLVPQDASDTLPSRGQVVVRGTLNGADFLTVLEPDGKGSHWLKVPPTLHKAARVKPGDSVEVEIRPSDEEPEPDIPPDLAAALKAAGIGARATWDDITPAARRDWVHWIISPKKAETRVKRIAAACDMLAEGKRRVCCFDRSGKFSGSLSCPTPMRAEPAAAPKAKATPARRPRG